MRKIRIMHLRLPSRVGWGGPDSGMLNSGNHLDPDGFEFSAVYMKRAGDKNNGFLGRYNKAGLDFSEFEGKGIFDLRQFNEMTEFIKQKQPDFIHCHEERTNLYGYLLKLRLPHTKVVSSVHGEWLIDSPRRWLFSYIDSWVLNRLDARIAVSKQVVGFAARLGIKIDRIVENGIDVDAWSPNSNQTQALDISKPDSRSWVGFVGRISYEKGPLEFVEIASYVAKRNNNVDFLVAGNGEAASHMRQYVNELGLEKRFYFLGEINAMQLRTLYRSLDVLVCSSHSEGLPNNLLEACAMMTPIIATRVGGVPELIHDGYNGLLAEAGDISGLANKVLQVIADPDLSKQMGIHAREFVIKHFSVTSHVTKMGQLYQDMMNQSVLGLPDTTLL